MGKADLLSFGKNVSVKGERPSVSASRLTSFYRKALAVAALSAVACGGNDKRPVDNEYDSGKPNPSEMDGGAGGAGNETDSGKKNPCEDLTLDDLPKGLGLQVLNGNVGKLTLSGGAYDKYSVDIPSGAVDHDGNTAIWMREVTGLNVPSGMSKLPQVEGIDYELIDTEKPFIDDGVQCVPNIVKLKDGLDKEDGPEIFAPKIYADMLFCEDGECEQGNEEASFNSQLTEEGTRLKTGHFSTFFPLDNQPVVKSEGGNNLVVMNLSQEGHLTFDLSRVTDERSHIGELLELDVDGYSFVRVSGSADQWISTDKFEEGDYELKAQVKGANNITSGFAPDVSETLSFNLTVDGQNPCADVSCENGECSMGECVCDNGYEPSEDKKSCEEAIVADPCEDVDCDDNNACTADSCADGQCGHEAIQCEDNGNLCDGDEACNPGSGECESVDAPECGLPANVDFDCAAPVCVSETGCDVELVANETACDGGAGKCVDGQCEANECNSDADCGSDNACTIGTCGEDNTCAHQSVDPGDGNACTVDSCDPVTGVSNTPIAANDGNACTENDTCNPSTGAITGSAVDCDDSNACTTDGCDSASGCTHTAVSPDDGNACTVDSCDPVTGVSNTPIAANDGNACTVNDQCDPATGAVTGSPRSCNDGNACTSDSCSPSSGCRFTAVDVSDGNACTADSCDSGTGAVSHTAINPSDGNACTVDSCDPVTGVSNVPVNVNDNDGCTVDSCNSGTGAISHNAVDCGAGQQCVSTGPQSYECQELAPVVSGLAVDCSSSAGLCASSQPGDVWTYPVSFNVTNNPDSCVGTAERISGSGTSGSLSVGTNGTGSYTTGNGAGDIIRLTVECENGGGSDSDSTTITLE